MATVTITIDGKVVEAEEGTFLLKVARENGIEIPTLCDHPILEPNGSCRICSVEVKEGGRTRLATACNSPIADGMEVFTDTERVINNRKVLIELLLARHSQVEVIQQLADEWGVDRSRFEEMPSEPCILCGRCVNVCSDVVGAWVLGFESRGPDRQVVAPYLDGPESEFCIGCGACAEVCPTGHVTMVEPSGRVLIHSEMELGPAKPIYVPTLQAVPSVPVIDYDSCIHFKTDECRVCEKMCERDAINHDMVDEFVEFEVGNIVVATGFKTFDPSVVSEYGYGRYDNVLTSLEFERLCNASGPTGGKVRLTNGEEPESVAIFHCVGSRNKKYNEWCSRVCCMYSLKFGHLLKEKVPAAAVYELYIDMRAFGKGYEEFYERVQEEGVIMVRSKGAEVTDFAEVTEEQGKLVVKCEDVLAGCMRRIPVDMVILSVGLEPNADSVETAQKFNIACGEKTWYIEKHPKLDPVATATDGVYVVGCCQGPKDIPDTVAQGSAAAGRILADIQRGTVEVEAITAVVNEDLCCGCQTCVSLCPYSAPVFNEEKGVSEINEALCKGCGTCVSACPGGAITGRHFTDKQIMAELEGILS